MDNVTVCAALVVPTVWLPNARLVGVTATEAAPVPFSATVSVGLAGSLLMILSDADRAPTAVGLNVTLIEQLAPATRLAPHVLVWAKSPGLVPVRLTLVIVSGAVPVLDNVTVCAALVVPTVWLPNVREVGVAEATGPVPVPLRATVCGLVGSESAMDNVAALAPIAVGLNATLTVQFEFAGTKKHPLIKRKSAGFEPFSVTPLIVRVVVPLLSTVTILYALVVFTNWLPNASDVGVTLTTVPVPFSDTVNIGFTGSLLLMVSDPVCVPAAVGLNATFIVQLAPAAKLVPQLLVWAKFPVVLIPLIVKGTGPVLDKVTDWAVLVVFTSWIGKVSDAGNTLAIGTTAICAVLDHPEARVVVNGPPVAYPANAFWTRACVL